MLRSTCDSRALPPHPHSGMTTGGLRTLERTEAGARGAHSIETKAAPVEAVLRGIRNRPPPRDAVCCIRRSGGEKRGVHPWFSVWHNSGGGGGDNMNENQ